MGVKVRVAAPTSQDMLLLQVEMGCFAVLVFWCFGALGLCMTGSYHDQS